jgi:hypothetical protein
MKHVVDLETFPLDDPDGPKGRALIEACRRGLAARGLFNLEGFVRPRALERCVAEVLPVFDSAPFFHKRSHNIYFDDGLTDLPPDHPALKRFETINHTVCADQIPDSLLCRIYAWPPLVRFLYRAGEALNWHFDRSEFTITLLLQAPEAGGAFQYRSGLRSESDPNYDGVARFLAGEDDAVETLPLTAGTLTLFKGKDTAHRVTPVAGARDRLVVVFSYYERPDGPHRLAPLRGLAGPGPRGRAYGGMATPGEIHGIVKELLTTTAALSS